jgi:hypothetical protein
VANRHDEHFNAGFDYAMDDSIVSRSPAPQTSERELQRLATVRLLAEFLKGSLKTPSNGRINTPSPAQR